MRVFKKCDNLLIVIHAFDFYATTLNLQTVITKTKNVGSSDKEKQEKNKN